MAEPPRGLIYLPIIYLWTGAVEGNLLASLAPPVHLTGEKLGLTLLVCVVSDFRRGHLEINWRSASDEGYSYASPYNGAVTRKHRGHNAVAIITVVTSNWPSYSCSVRRRKHSRAKKLHNIASTADAEMCNNDNEEREALAVRTNIVVVMCMRLLLMKIIVFDALMTVYVIKWKSSGC